jgi:hypothetical protein
MKTGCGKVTTFIERKDIKEKKNGFMLLQQECA